MEQFFVRSWWVLALRGAAAVPFGVLALVWLVSPYAIVAGASRPRADSPADVPAEPTAPACVDEAPMQSRQMARRRGPRFGPGDPLCQVAYPTAYSNQLKPSRASSANASGGPQVPAA